MKSIALLNGKIYVQRDVFAQAVYAEDGIIRLVGTNEEIQAAVKPGTRIVDCGGKTVIPGLNDSHLHIHMLGLNLSRVDTMGVTSMAVLIQRCRD